MKFNIFFQIHVVILMLIINYLI